MAKARKPFRKRRNRKRGKRRSKRGKGYTYATDNVAGLMTVPRGLPRGPDSLVPSVYKCTLHTRTSFTADAGASPATSVVKILHLNRAGNPYESAYAYGISPSASAISEGSSDVPGSIQRDPMNLFNTYGTAYVTYAVVRATFVGPSLSDANQIPALGFISQGVSLPGVGSANALAEFKDSFGLQLSSAGGTLANIEEVPGIMHRIVNASNEKKITSMQRGFRMKPILGASNMIGDTYYATEWDRANNAIVAPDKSVYCGVGIKDLTGDFNPPAMTVLLDIYQVTLFLNPRTRDVSRNAA